MKKLILLIAVVSYFNIMLYAQSGIITTICGNGLGAGTYTCCYSGDGGQATAAGLDDAFAVAIDAFGNTYVADQVNNRVRKINTLGIISTFAGNGIGAFGGDGGQATGAELHYPDCLAFDAAGNLYIGEYASNRVRKVNTNGIISLVAGNGNAGYGGDSGQATVAELYNPSGLALDALGNLYISDEGNNCIRMVSTSGIITTITGTGTAGFSGDGGAASAAQLYQPSGIAFDAVGNLYFADARNNRIRIINTSGIINTFAGDGTTGYSGDGGQAAAAALCYPLGLIIDPAGNLYIADFCNNVIRIINTSGIISTFAGIDVPGFYGDGGQANAAELNYPTSVALDASGNLYIADSYNNRIRRVCANTCSFAGIEQYATSSSISIYPNPTNNLLQVIINNEQITQLQITDILGNELMQVAMQQGKASIDVSNLQSGIYFIKTNLGTQKFIKQ